MNLTEKQQDIFRRALEIHNQHSGARDVWRQSGWRGALVDMKKKMDRCWAAFSDNPIEMTVERESQIIDDALDLINYTGFFIQSIQDGNRDGEWDWS